MPEADIASPPLIGTIVTAVPVVLWLAALVCAAVAVWRAPRPITLGLIADKLVRYLFVFPLGLQGLWAFFGHVFLPEESANAIGWAPSPFQYEVGVANLGLGLASFYAAFKGFEARAAVAIAVSCFLAGAGFGHVMDILAGDNLAPGNAGPILITDFLTPIVVLILLVLWPGSSRAVSVKAKDTVAGKIEEALKEVQQEAKPEPPHRIEDELEHARKAMREALTAGSKPEVLTPARGTARSGDAPRRKGLRDRANT
jgi:Family of unknown function (DUF6790)